MLVFPLLINVPLQMDFTGKFVALTPEWQHQSAPLYDYELIVMTQGTLYIAYENIKYAVNAGQSLLLPPCSSPTSRRIGYQPSNCNFYWLHFSCCESQPGIEEQEALRQVYKWKDRIFVPQQLTIPKPERILVLMRQLQDYVLSGYESSAINYMTTTILCELYNQSYQLVKNERAPSDTHWRHPSMQKQLYHDFVEYVRQNYQNNLKTSDVARHFGYNEKYLSHLFKQLVGMSLKQYIIHLQIEKANFYLADTNLPIKTIAERLGFSYSHVFAKSYRKVMGITPSEYRNAFSKRLLNYE